MRDPREHFDLLRLVTALGTSLTLICVACSSSYDAAPRRLVDRGDSIDHNALDPSATSILISSDAGTHALASDNATPGDGVGPGVGNATFCTLSFDGGPCTTPMNVYWHNPATGMCELKIYGGCEGNGNRFASVGECVEMCGGSAPAPCESSERLYQPGQSVETECGRCECDPAGSGQLLCPKGGDAALCDALAGYL
jgi:hypothetical protein